MKRVEHTLEAYYTKDSKILILGSMPSVKSREIGFYYMHPQNRFWQILSKVYKEEIGESVNDKKMFLDRHKIALWDVIKSCDIHGSSDASIKNIEINNIKDIIKKSKIERIFVTGKKAYNFYNKYCLKDTLIEATYLYSPSPANCSIDMNRLVENYKIINNKE